MPAAEFTHRAKANSTVDHAWRGLQRAETWEAIPGVDEVFDARHADDGSLIAYRFFATAGGSRYEGAAKVSEVDPPVHMALGIESSEIGGRIETQLAEVSDRVIEITVTVRLESRGFLAGVFFPVVRQAVGNGLPDSVEDFARRLTAA